MAESFSNSNQLTTDKITSIQATLLGGYDPLNPIPSSSSSASSLPIAAAAPPALSVSGSTSYTGTALAIAPNLAIAGTDNFNGARVFIDQNFNNSKDRLAVGNSTSNSGTVSGIDWNYNPTTGVLTLNNSAGSNNIPSTYQEVLRQVTYTNNDSLDPGNSRTIRFSLGNLLANPQNNHFYQFVDNNGIQWTDANTAANNLNYFGLKGYLTTITSATEQQFIDARIQGNGWIGASDAAQEGNWKWVTGPENGQSFWSGGINGSPVNNSYTNWNDGRGGEPNNADGNENYGHVIGDTRLLKADGSPALGKWNDLANQRPVVDEYTPKGYIVEYGGLAGDPALNVTGSVTVSLSASTQSSPLTNPDFTKDGKPELLWRNSNSGENGVWVLDYDSSAADTGFKLNPKTKLIQQEADQDWKVAGFYDINKDGITDIFWRNYRTGDNGIWLMKDDGSGINVAPGSALLPREPDTNWTIEGVGDFDNDGTANILWRNYRTGDNGIWQVDYNANASGNRFSFNTDKSKLLLREPDSYWVIKGWADFTGDKVLDILWRNEKTGENAIWKLNTNATGASPYVNSSEWYKIGSVPIVDNGWEIQTAIDFNKDGVADILWRNNTTGENSIWVMTSGGNPDTAKTALIDSVPVSVGAGWEIQETADFTGDQIPDIVWRNYSTDENLIWRMKIDGSNRVALDKRFALNKAGDLKWEIVDPRVNSNLS
jgi:hypothetical protein